MLMSDADEAWRDALRAVLTHGRPCAPRGVPILEIEHRALAVDMNRAVVTAPERRINYRFMAAEAWWICAGRDDVESVAAYNARMREFSDDGVTLAGAYGPRVASQIEYVVAKLLEDRDTRQATLTVWTPNPAPSKDIPCTVAMDFKIRRDELNIHVFMRSSDVWLGVPYDVFSFSAVGILVASMVSMSGPPVTPGALYVTAASSHLYERDADAARAIVDAGPSPSYQPSYQPSTPPARYASPSLWMETLAALRDARRGDARRWWEL